MIDDKGVATNTFTHGHMGADCRTPDAYLTDLWTKSIAERMAPTIKDGLKS
ncbi:hypothetical protein BSFA1_10600 [Burkholderia sp. SFA1]|nr:hypothetical protein BSFA1_10600 [Burkholderia sp. SFA1]